MNQSLLLLTIHIGCKVLGILGYYYFALRYRSHLRPVLVVISRDPFEWEKLHF
uniref:Uncharacterized protein n=1 Tax=Anguilla anguilla TaxID=7936 RepID=A0A0E9W2J0_ANGAN